MYFANMYCYGHDNDLVGITGIVGCMGVIYVGAASIYAVHIPNNSAELDAAGGKAFAEWVTNQEGQVGKGQGYLFGFCNGANRSTAGAELKAIKKALKSPDTTLYRINKHLGPESGKFGADAVVIMLERVHVTPREPKGCAIWFKANNKITWQAGGKSESDQYKKMAAFTGAQIPSDLEAGWWLMDEMTTTSTEV